MPSDLIVDKYQPQLSVIGAVLLEPELMGEAALMICDSDFSERNCLVVWRVLRRMFQSGQPMDITLIKAELVGFDGVLEFLAAAMAAAPAKGAFSAHVQALKRISTVMQLQDLGSQLAQAQRLEDALQIACKITALTVQRQARQRRGMGKMLQSFADRHSSRAELKYLPWPVRCLNDSLPVGPGRYGIIGGYPSDGKTAFALEAAISQARHGYRVGFYSFETSCDDLEDRMLASLASIDMQHIFYNRLDDAAWGRYAIACESAELPLEVIEASGMSPEDIRADALAARYDVVFVDYLQLIQPTYRSRSGRWEDVSDISRSLQQLAKTTGMDVIALSQLSRPQEDKKGFIQPPTMSDLRESGQIEQDADYILLLYRLDRRNVRAERYLDVAKNKMGVTGHFPVRFIGETQHFADSPAQLPPAHHPRRRNVSLAETQEMPVITSADPKLPF